jgi:hypothetical protein
MVSEEIFFRTSNIVKALLGAAIKVRRTHGKIWGKKSSLPLYCQYRSPRQYKAEDGVELNLREDGPCLIIPKDGETEEILKDYALFDLAIQKMKEAGGQVVPPELLDMAVSKFDGKLSELSYDITKNLL